MLRYLPIFGLIACGGGESPPDGGGILLIGECEAPVGTAIATSPISVFDQSCAEAEVNGVVESQAEWDVLFAACAQPVPPELDLTTQRAAIVSLRCTGVNLRFAVDTVGEVVVGVLHQLQGGACGGNVLVVPLPRTSATVRIATCQETCPSCPPVP